MSKEMTSLLIWTLVFAFIIFSTNKKLKKLEGKIYLLHIFLAWLLLVINSTGFRMLGWAVGHPQSITEYFFIPVGPIPAWFNLFTWAGNTLRQFKQ